MTIRVGDIELLGVQAIYTDEPRVLVEHCLPGHPGSIFQDLGRRAVALEIEGILFGDDATSALASLRAAQADAKPLAFAADIAMGIDFTDVRIESLRVRQIAGFRNRYGYAITLREHVDEPESPGVEMAVVDAGIGADAASWVSGALGAAAALQNIGALPALAAADPAVLDHLSADDLAGAIGAAAAGLTGGGLASIVGAVGGPAGPFGDIIGTIKSAELSDAVAAYRVIQDPSTIVETMATVPGMLDRLGGRDLARGVVASAGALGGADLGAIVGALGEAGPPKLAEFIDELRKAGVLGAFAAKLGAEGIDIRGALAGIDPDLVPDLVGGIAGTADLLATLRDAGARIAPLIEALRSYDPLAALPGEARPS